MYKPEFGELAERLVLLDAQLTDEKLSEFLGVTTSTFNKWKKEHPEFSESIARAKKPADGMIANALFRRALGYDYEETVPIKMKSAMGGDEIRMVKVKKHLPGDVNAQSLWLRNRQSALWKANPEPAPDDDENKKPITGIRVTVQDYTAKSQDEPDQSGAESGAKP